MFAPLLLLLLSFFRSLSLHFLFQKISVGVASVQDGDSNNVQESEMESLLRAKCLCVCLCVSVCECV